MAVSGAAYTFDKVVFDLGEFPKSEGAQRSAAEAATIDAN
jgi:hypothetical protein